MSGRPVQSLTMPAPRPPYEIARLGDIPLTDTRDHEALRLAGAWRQIRHHLMIREFSANAFTCTAGRPAGRSNA